jgi:FixJ family two-component response regulator
VGNPERGPGRNVFVFDSVQYQYLGLIDACCIYSHSVTMTDGQGQKSIQEPLVVVVVDDDESVRESLPDLLKEFGFSVLAFSSADEFLASESVDRTMCLVLDMVMPGMSGLDLQAELKNRGRKIPIIFITAQKDESVRKRVIDQGAVDVLLKPFSDTALRKALSKAMDGD